jgi:protein TonB
MSTNVSTFNNWDYDNPWHWRRLFSTILVAVALWFGILWLFAELMNESTGRLPEPEPVEAQIVEIAELPLTIKTPTPHPSRPLSEPSSVPSPIHETEPPPQSETKPVALPANLVAPTPAKEDTPTVKQEHIQVPNIATPFISARAISQPKPQIPDELRQDALSTSAVARFHVASDGTTTAELVKPTTNPKLNRLLINTLKNWRFFPAMKEGKPVESTQEIVIKIEVK